jgi:hypothetical protein
MDGHKLQLQDKRNANAYWRQWRQGEFLAFGERKPLNGLFALFSMNGTLFP